MSPDKGHTFFSNRELIEQNRIYIAGENRKQLMNAAVLQIWVCALLFIYSFLSPGPRWPVFRIHIAVLITVSAAVFLLCSSTGIAYKRIYKNTACYLYSDFLLLYTGMLYFMAPVVPQGCFYGILILHAMMYYSSPLYICINSTVFCGAFTGYAFLSGSPAVLSVTINSITVVLICCICGFYLQKIKLDSIETGRQLEIKRSTDILTGLPNRIKLNEELDIISENRNRDQLLGVFMIDIDYFKKFNDSYGHAAGDICLSRIGACFKSFAERYHIDIFRYGGEEFIGLVRSIPLSRIKNRDAASFDYQKAAEELLAEVHALAIPCCSGVAPVVTISAGYAVGGSKNIPVRDLIGRADKALYSSKENGRGRITGWKENADCCTDAGKKNRMAAVRRLFTRKEAVYKKFVSDVKKIDQMITANSRKAAQSNIKAVCDPVKKTV